MLEKSYSGFTVNVDEHGVCVLTFNQPEKLNGLNRAVKRDVTEAMTQIAYDDAVRVVVLTGGEHFSAGDDFAHQGPQIWDDARSAPITRGRHDSLATYASLRTISQGMNRAVRALDKLTIAAIDGFAIQSGLSLALCCDFRLCTARAKLGSGTLRMGYLPDEGGHWLLTQILGVPKTKDFLFRKRMVSGEEAHALGLVGELVAAPDELMPRAMELACELAQGPQAAMRLLKHAVDNAADLTFEQACMDIAVRTGISDHHPDAHEGAAAFTAKPRRKPKFNQT